MKFRNLLVCFSFTVLRFFSLILMLLFAIVNNSTKLLSEKSPFKPFKIKRNRMTTTLILFCLICYNCVIFTLCNDTHKWSSHIIFSLPKHRFLYDFKLIVHTFIFSYIHCIYTNVLTCLQTKIIQQTNYSTQYESKSRWVNK